MDLCEPFPRGCRPLVRLRLSLARRAVLELVEFLRLTGLALTVFML